MKKSAYITFRTSEEVKKFLEEQAKQDDRTISYLINKILEEYIKSVVE